MNFIDNFRIIFHGGFAIAVILIVILAFVYSAFLIHYFLFGGVFSLSFEFKGIVPKLKKKVSKK